MKKQILLIFIAVLMTGCASKKNIQNFSDVVGKGWKLIEIKMEDKSVLFNRANLAKEDAGDIFTLTVNTETINGKGAPNLFITPYKQGDNQSLTVTPISVTTPAPLRQPERLRENDFFTYLQNVYKWEAVNNNLELLSKTEDGDRKSVV